MADLLLERLNRILADPASDIHEHLLTLAGWCARLGAQNVIELGVRSGESTTAFLVGLRATGGMLWSVDLDPEPAMPLGPDPYRWDFIRGSDTDPAVLRRLPSGVDIVFIDTSHAFEHTLVELTFYVPRVRSGGVVLLHDTMVEHPVGVEDEPFPVRRAIEAFCEDTGLSWSNVENNNGLGTIVVP